MQNLAKFIIEKHNSRNPYEIARKENIIIVPEELGNINGYYNNAMGQKFIHINRNLPEYFQSYVVAHMLYKSLTNSDEMMFLKEKVAAKFTETEKQANHFACLLTVDEDELKEAGSFKTLMKKYGMTDQDMNDLSNRFTSIWKDINGMDIDDQTSYVINKISALADRQDKQ